MKRRFRLPYRLLLAAILAMPLMSGCLHDPVAEQNEERREAFDLLTKGQELKRQGDYLLARDVLLDASKVSERPIIFYEIGNCYYHLDNYEQAAVYYEKALALRPDYSLAQAELDLVRAELAHRTGESSTTTATGESDKTDRPAPMLAMAATPEDGAHWSEKADETPAATLTPSPTPRPTRTPDEAPPRDEQLPDMPQATPVPEPTEATPVPTPATPAREATNSATGPFGGLNSPFDRMRGPEETDFEAVAQIPEEQARQVIFPELDSKLRLDPKAEAQAAEEAERLGRFDEAVRRWTRVLGAEPHNATARVHLANSLQRTGRTRRAEEEFLKAISYAPQDPYVYFEQGNFYVRSGEVASARAAFAKAIELDPDYLKARNNLGALYLQTGNSELAIGELEQVVAADNQFASAWLNLALARDDAGRPASEILEALESYTRLNPSSDPQSEKWLRDLRRRVQQEASN